MQYFLITYEIKCNIIHNPSLLYQTKTKESISVQSSFDLQMIPKQNLFWQKYSFSR